MNYRINPLLENTALGALSCDRSDTGHCYFYIGQSDEPAQVLYTLTPSATSQVILPAKPVALCVRDTLIGKQDEWDACKAAGWVLGPKGLGNINANEAHTVVYVSKS